MINWAKDHILIVGILVVAVFVFGGLATNESEEGGVKDIPETTLTGHDKEGDKKYERK